MSYQIPEEVIAIYRELSDTFASCAINGDEETAQRIVTQMSNIAMNEMMRVCGHGEKECEG
jgi:hypothetical protein